MVCSTEKIVGLCTISRVDHSTAQTRELECTKVVIPQVIYQGNQCTLCDSESGKFMCCFATGLRVVEIAHDMQTQVTRYVTAELGLINSYDTWHGITTIVLLC